jgi:hypothetical protein
VDSVETRKILYCRESNPRKEMYRGENRPHSNTVHHIVLGWSDEMGGQVARVGGIRNAYSILVGKSEETDNLGDQGVEGRFYNEGRRVP